MPYKDADIQKIEVRKNQNYKRLEYQRFKESNPCSDCKGFFHYSIMQHDHRDSEQKLFLLSQRSASFGSKIFMKEMNKCDLVCANCHGIRTWKRKNGIVV
jgi:hypothetical protein